MAEIVDLSSKRRRPATPAHGVPQVSPETAAHIERLKAEYGVTTNTEVLLEALRRASVNTKDNP